MRAYAHGESMTDEDSLAHYGVKGMKWGVSRALVKGMDKSGFTSLATKNVRNSERRTAAGVKAGQTINRLAGKQKDSSGVTRQQARQQIRKDNRNLNRKLEDFESSGNRSNQIRSARDKERQVKRDYEDLAGDLKARKKAGEIGKNAARVQLNQLKNTRYETIYKSASQTAGEQIISNLVAALGTTPTAGLYR